MIPRLAFFVWASACIAVSATVPISIALDREPVLGCVPAAVFALKWAWDYGADYLGFREIADASLAVDADPWEQ